MGVMSDYDLQLQEIREVMGSGAAVAQDAVNVLVAGSNPAFPATDDGEPKTPKEIAEHKVAMAVRDCWLASAELVKLKAQDVHAAPFILKAEGDLWSIKLRIDLLLSEIRATEPKLKVVSRG